MGTATEAEATGRVGIATRAIVCLTVLAVGVGIMKGLESMKRPPAATEKKKTVLQVEALRARARSEPVVVTGYGDAEPRQIVTIAPEVAGRVVAVHDRLEVGETIEKGELLFAIDTRNYDAAVVRSQAAVERIEKQRGSDAGLLEAAERSRDLAEEEFRRLKRLLEKDRVGSLSRVQASERAAIAARSAADRLRLAVELAPVQLREAKAALAVAEANQARCRVRAPFRARLKTVAIEEGQYAAPGIPAVVLADDSELEIRVSLDSRDARRWLRFDEARRPEGMAWFAKVAPVDCAVRWTEDPEQHAWTGRLDRIVSFDRATRTLTVAIIVDGTDARGAEGALPLVEGMFCLVEIPGRTLDGAYRLPRRAVTFENCAYLAVDGRLKTVPVEVAKVTGDDVLITDGIAEGDVVITTRLTAPLEGTAVAPTIADATAEEAAD